MKHWFLVALLMPAAAIEDCLAQSESSPLAGPVAVVYRLYRDFAWEAVISEPRGDDSGVMEQPKAVLERYFDTRLTNLILKDRECAQRTGAICNLDFAFIWDSQDPAAYGLTITPGTGDTVDVAFKYPDKGSPTRITYQTTKASGHWRISDVRFKSQKGRSLLSILQGK
jgi:hypothetical protein